MVLNRQQVEEKIEEENLVEDYPHLETQITQNGFDLTAGEIHRFKGPGKLDFSNSERKLPETEAVVPEKKDESDDYGWWVLEPGVYKVVANEKVNLPNDMMAFTFPRSSLLRMGVFIQNAAWEAGFSGTGEFLLQVNNPEGVEIKENARVNQIVFQEMDEVDEGYDGRYHEA